MSHTEKKHDQYYEMANAPPSLGFSTLFFES